MVQGSGDKDMWREYRWVQCDGFSSRVPLGGSSVTLMAKASQGLLRDRALLLHWREQHFRLQWEGDVHPGGGEATGLRRHRLSVSVQHQRALTGNGLAPASGCSGLPGQCEHFLTHNVMPVLHNSSSYTCKMFPVKLKSLKLSFIRVQSWIGN